MRSAARNILRLIDVYLFFVGAFVILLTKRNQRLGDLVADTLVVRELAAPSAGTRMASPSPRELALLPWDVSGVTGEELAAVRSFLMRRNEFTFDARVQISTMLAQKLRPKVVGAEVSQLPDEPFLELLARVKAARL